MFTAKVRSSLTCFFIPGDNSTKLCVLQFSVLRLSDRIELKTVFLIMAELSSSRLALGHSFGRKFDPSMLATQTYHACFHTLSRILLGE